MKITLCLLTLALSAMAHGAPATVVFDARKLSWDERCTVEVLQGLANRQGPALYLDNGDPWDQRWLDIYAQRAGLRYERVTGLPELIGRFRGSVRGLVVYDPAVDGCRYAAVTLAGVEDLLPVTADLLSGKSPAWPASGVTLAGMGIPVKHDLRGRFGTSLDACEWALREVMPRTCRWLAHAVDGGTADGTLTGVCGPMSGFDWTALHRGFVFNLGASAQKVNAYGAMVGGSPDQARLYARILDAMTPPAMVTGFGDPEDVWCSLLSRHNAYSFHAYRNWSFHSRVRPDSAPPYRQAVRFTPENTQPDTARHYVCFMTSEGDTMKGPIPFFYESWFDPARGKVPVNWGINPLLARYFPAMLRYYYDTATPNDYFFAGCSGAGYCYPDTMPRLDMFTIHTAVACKRAGVEAIDMWGGNLPATHAAYARHAKPLGLSSFAGPARVKFLPDGTPIAFHELGYWQTHELGDNRPWSTVFQDPAKRARAVRRLVDRIERIAARMKPPFIILVYGDLHTYDRHASLYKAVADALNPKQFKAARLDEAFAAMRAWSRDRVMVGTESINEPLMLAALTGTTTTVPIALTNGSAKAVEVRIDIRGRSVDAGGAKQSPPLWADPEANALAASRTDKPVLKLGPHEVRTVPVLQYRPRAAQNDKVTLEIRTTGHSERVTGTLDAIPGGDPARPVTYSAMWHAETLSHPVGTVVEHPDGFLGRVCASPSPTGRTDCLVAGPYAAREAGAYIAAFRVQVSGPPSAGALPSSKALTLEMSSGGWAGTGKVLAERSLSAADLAPAGTWRWILLQGDWPGPPNLMELRVQWHGIVPVLVDRIALFRMNTPPPRGERSPHP